MNFSNIKWLKDGSIDLLVESYSSSALVLQIRGLNDNEMIIADHTTSSDRSLVSSSVAVTAPPRMLTIRSSSTGIKRGTCFVRISLRIEGVVVALLFSDYVTDTSAPAFPNGRVIESTEGPGLIRIINGTNPAAGAQISETVPTGALWKIKAISAELTADATTAGRQGRFEFSDGSNIFLRTSTITVSASQVMRFTTGDGLATEDLTTLDGNLLVLTNNVLLPAGYKIVTNSLGFQAGDNWGAPIIQVEEWLQP